MQSHETCPLCQKSTAEVIDISDNFMIMPDAGALVEGWLLLFPKTHILTMSDTPEQYRDEIDTLVQAYSKRLKHHYGAVTLFEHGPAELKTTVGCGVDHAHLHLVPINSNLLAKAKTVLPDTKWQPIVDLHAIRDMRKAEQAYLYLQQDQQSFVAFAKTFPSQFFRRIIADELHVTEFDWRKMLAFDHAHNTALTLTGNSVEINVAR